MSESPTTIVPSPKTPYSLKIVSDIPDDDTQNMEICYRLTNTQDFIPLTHKIVEVRLKKTEEEKEIAKKAYRKAYAAKADVKQKIAERLKKPEVIKKRKEYASKASVKLRKKELAARARKIRKTLKANYRDIYDEITEKVIEAKENLIDECLVVNEKLGCLECELSRTGSCSKCGVDAFI